MPTTGVERRREWDEPFQSQLEKIYEELKEVRELREAVQELNTKLFGSADGGETTRGRVPLLEKRIHTMYDAKVNRTEYIKLEDKVEKVDKRTTNIEHRIYFALGVLGCLSTLITIAIEIWKR